MFLGANGLEDNLTVILSDALYDFDVFDMPNDSVSAISYRLFQVVYIDENLVFYDKPHKKPPTNFALSGVYKFLNQKNSMKLQRIILKIVKLRHSYQIFWKNMENITN